MNRLYSSRRTPLVVVSACLLSVLLLLALEVRPLFGKTSAQSAFPPGAVVQLQGTPHLWIADEAGVLHWGGDTRALQGRFVDWNNRIVVSLDALKALRRGDPYLSAGLLKDGDPIYLVKWETSESVPRLLHIQCIADVELFGIGESNYGLFVIDRADWEARFRIPVGTLQRAELASADPSAASCARRPKLKISAADVAGLAPALARYGLAESDVNVERTVAFGLTASVADPGREPVAMLSAPLVRPPSPSDSALLGSQQGTAIGVLKAGRTLDVPGTTDLSPGTYLVVVRGGATPRMVFVPSGANPQERVTSLTPSVRKLGRDVVSPQTIMSTDSVCYSWNRVQVCTQPSPQQTMTGSEQTRMNAVMNASVAKLVGAGRLRSGDINVAATLPDVEGTLAVSTGRASMLAAPVNTPATTPSSTDVLVAALYVEQQVEIPGYPTVPPGDYAIRAKLSGSAWVAELTAVDGRKIDLPAQNVEVLAEAREPAVIVVNLAIIFPPASPPISLCLFHEECA
ncbi:MAG TPA: hypothetical protein VFX49_21385 [Chloroflexota bacterium]|nr:hypothetical protein [Chloroflexota bacterium]